VDRKTVDTREKKDTTSLVTEALSRFRDCDSFESENRKEGLDDLNMLAGKNHWPAKIVDERNAEGRPTLTINRLPSFVDQNVGDARLNQVAIKVSPYGGGATREVADILNGLIRNICNMSKADIAFQTAQESAASNGFGYWRITTDYVDDGVFDQEIRIERIKNPFTVYFDPSHQKHDGSDARFVFITEMISRAEYGIRYPSKTLSEFPVSNEDAILWREEQQVRVAEYWVKRPKKLRRYLLSDDRIVDGDDWDKIVDELTASQQTVHVAPGPDGQPTQVEGSAPEGSGYPEQILNPVPTIVRQRTVDFHEIEQYIIDGTQIIEGPHVWAGKYIPIIPVWGKEICIDGARHLRSLIRFAKDPQKMYNYFRTAATETVALTPKAPWVMEESQIGNHAEQWASSNRKNLPYLLYKHKPGVNPPTRQVVTQTAIGEITESNIANDEMKATTSTFDASLGAKSNETSGRAILARQREGDVANFAFIDNQHRAILYTGEVLVDLIPKIYDTERTELIINDVEEEIEVTINQTVRDEDTGQDVIINDLSLGRYKTTITKGPSFTTQRAEAMESMFDFVRTAPGTAAAVMDLIAENADWPNAAKFAARLKKFLPPGILTEEEGGAPAPTGPSPEQVTAGLKAEGIDLNNQKKRLDISEKTSEMEGRIQAVAEAAARGVIQQMVRGGQSNE